LRRHSPCVGICKLDDTTGYCLGCGRSGDEVAQWVVMSEAQRDDVWLKLPARLEILGVRLRLLPWSPEELLIWVAETIAGRRGTWMIGGSDAVAKFACTAEREIEIKNARDAVIARSAEAAFRLQINDKVRAFAFAEDGPIVLGLPNGRAAMPLCTALSALGPDGGAIDERRRHHSLFDLGFGRTSSRYCIRTDDAALAEILSAYAGRDWPEVEPIIGNQLESLRATCIAETAVARIEVLAPISLPSGDAPRTPADVPPGLVKSWAEIPADLSLPDYASPVAIFYLSRGPI
jgi:predicted Fe-S protein YdhL (DUF1289 family)